jgi:hypothetical protein
MRAVVLFALALSVSFLLGYNYAHANNHQNLTSTGASKTLLESIKASDTSLNFSKSAGLTIANQGYIIYDEEDEDLLVSRKSLPVNYSGILSYTSGGSDFYSFAKQIHYRTLAFPVYSNKYILQQVLRI